MGIEWSQKEFCHVGDSPKMLKKKIPKELAVKFDTPYTSVWLL